MKRLALDATAIAATLDDWSTQHPGCAVLALVPEAEQARLALLQQACRARGVALAGALFPALVSAEGFASDGLWLARLPTATTLFLLDGMDAAPALAADRIADAVAPHLPSVAAAAPEAAAPTLYLVFDALLGQIGSIVDGLYLRLADRVQYAGVNAGSETFEPMACLFDAERRVGNGVLGLLIPALAPTRLEHGYAVPERVMTATSTAGNCIHSIDWQPAFDVYQEIIGQEYGIALTRANFYQYAVHFPVGILRAHHDVLVRIPVALAGDGTLRCAGDVPENAMLALLRAPGADAATKCIHRLAAALGAPSQALHGRGLLTFYCAGRRMHLGDGAVNELRALQAQSGAALLGGALSLGEVGSIEGWGCPMFHNAALVCTPWRGA